MIRELAIITGVHWLVVLFYLLATIGNTWGLLFNREKVERLAHRLLIVGLLIHGAAILSWWFIVGHGPYLARFEILSAMAWVMVVLYLVFRHFFPPVRPASLLVYPAALLLIGLGVFCTPAVQTLPPTFRGIWLVLHVTLYIISLPTIVITLAISLGYILKKRTGYAWVARLPDSETLDLLAYRFAGFGFVFWSLAMLTGAIWAYQAWGRFWGRSEERRGGKECRSRWSPYH